MAHMRHEDIDRISALIGSVATKRTVLIVEHDLSVVANLSHRITVPRGRVLAEGDYATGRPIPGVREAYSGVGHACPTRAPLLAIKDLQAWYGDPTCCRRHV